MQVSDRRVTQEVGSRVRILEPNANKNLVLVLKDAVVALGYSGRAELQGVRTDTWIAEKITGVPSFRQGGNIASWQQTLPHEEDIRTTMLRLRMELADVCREMGPARYRVHIAAVGYRWSPKWPYVHQLLWEITPSPIGDETDYNYYRLQRDRRSCRDCIWVYPSGDLGRSWDRLKEAAEQVASKPKDAGSVERELSAVVRYRSGVSPYVGPDTMTIGIAPPEKKDNLPPLVRIRYHAVDPEKHVGTYSPWIIGPSLAVPPAVVTEEANAFVGNTKVWIALPDDRSRPGHDTLGPGH